jgi:hypothetical protein
MMDRLVPVSPGTLRDEVAKALALYLANQGMESGMCGPTAIGIMGMMQSAIDADDLSVILSEVKEDAIHYNKWIEEHHPSFTKQIVLDIAEKQEFRPKTAAEIAMTRRKEHKDTLRRME